MPVDNPKRDGGPNAGIENEPADRVPCDDPMTGREAFHLRTLSEQAHERDACATNLTKESSRDPRARTGERVSGLKDRGADWQLPGPALAERRRVERLRRNRAHGGLLQDGVRTDIEQTRRRGKPSFVFSRDGSDAGRSPDLAAKRLAARGKRQGPASMFRVSKAASLGNRGPLRLTVNGERLVISRPEHDTG
jgi:hypothetical protein